MSIIDDVLSHVGVGAKDNPPGRGSGRYPLGSGKKPFQHANAFMTRVQQLREQGMAEKDIATAMGFKSTTQLRVQYSLAKTEVRTKEADRARKLRDEGYSLNQITKMMGYSNDSSIRSLLNMDTYSRMKQAETTAEYLKKMVDEKGMIDVGAGVERLPELGGISREKFNEALYLLELDGYPTWGGGVPQATNPGKQTNLRVLCPPGTEHKEIFDYGKIHSIADYDKILTDGGDNIRNAFEFPASLESKRLQIRYADDDGFKRDGLIELRRNVPDLSLGNSHYAQVRILVDKDRYLKGMAGYGDDDHFPDGIDVIFHTNKTSDVPKMDVLKEIKKTPDGEIDRDNPFGALLKQKGGQSYYDDPDGMFEDKETGKKQSLSKINKTREEGDWNDWDDNIASQFLAKQPQYLIDRQLKITKEAKQSEFDDIMALTNPTIKRVLLQDFADDCESAAVHLKAAALPRQRWQVLLPIVDIKDNEIFAPNFKDGEQVALVRYPHSGTFEIPILTVNNKNKEGINLIGKNALDAVGINKHNADILSGADFDGDTVLVIPTGGSTVIKNSKPLFEDFEPKFEYGYSEKKQLPNGKYEYYRDGKKFKEMKNTQNEMGRISNLIMDMTLQNATNEELARAVKHSMVVIDAEKHKLDYKASEKDNDIKSLRKKYQPEGGASTLLTRAKSQDTVPKRKGNAKLNEDGTVRYDLLDDEKRFYTEKKKVRKKDENGKYLKDAKGNYVFETDENGKPIWEETGKIKERMQRSTKMAERSDARELISLADTPQERAYADYANYMKRLAADARKELVHPPKLEYNKEAAKTYSKEVESLDAKLNTALLNRPKERLAQTRANAIVKQKEDAAKATGEPLSKEQIRKEKQRALNQVRVEVGANREPVIPTDKEWEAIQAGAIHDSKLMAILKNSDKDRLRELATPRESLVLNEAKQNRIANMKAAGYTNDEIARSVGVSVSTVIKYL